MTRRAVNILIAVMSLIVAICSFGLIANAEGYSESKHHFQGWSFDEKKHWRRCSDCEEKAFYQDHMLDEHGACELCGYHCAIPGDLNNDERITTDDAIYVLYYTFFPTLYPINQNSDFNGDGRVDIDDAIYLLYNTFFPNLYTIDRKTTIDVNAIIDIEIEKEPNKTEYIVNDVFKPQGMVIRVLYGNGTIACVNEYRFSVSNTVLSKEGENKVEIQFQGTSKWISVNAFNANATVAVGDIVNFGQFTWIVLARDKTKALLVTENSVAELPFGTKDQSSTITWKSSSIRKWLNSTFYSTFSEEEQTYIQLTTGLNSSSSGYGTDNESTSDYVFLLSYDEFRSYVNTWLSTENHDFSERYIQNWWLRSLYSRNVLYKSAGQSNTIYYSGCESSSGVKPAMWVDYSGLVAVNELNIISAPTKREYLVGNDISLDGLSVEVKYSNGTSEIITSGFEVDTVMAGREGEIPITVEFMGKTTEFLVSASCSKGLSYTVNDDGKSCTITGTGTCNSLQIGIPSVIDGYSVTAIADSAFENCTNITYIGMPETLQRIGTRAFSNTGITQITIPKAVNYIGSQAFYNANNLGSVTYNTTYSLYQKGVFENKYIKKVIFNGEYAQTNALLNCTGIEEIVINTHRKSFSTYYGSSNSTTINLLNLQKITVISKEKWFDFAYDKIPFSNTYAIYVGNEEMKSCSIPFSYAVAGKWAFTMCRSISSISLTDGRISSIPYQAFKGCTGLTSIEIPSSVKGISSYSFSGCTNLTSVTIQEGVERIARSAFEKCTKIENFELPNSVSVIEDQAFQGCSSLMTINIPDSVIELSVSAFSGCTSLIELVIPNSVAKMSGSSFRSNSSLRKIVLPDCVTAIYSYSFSGCEALQTVELPATIETIGAYAFQGCSSLTSIKLPNGLQSIGDGAFHGTGIESIEIPESVSSIGIEAFENCIKLKKITFLNSFDSIPAGMFSGCESLESIVFPSGVKSIGNYAFQKCNSLTVELPNSVESIGEATFQNSMNCTLIIPTSVTEMFGCGICYNLKYIYLGKMEDFLTIKYYTYDSNNSLVTDTCESFIRNSYRTIYCANGEISYKNYKISLSYY